ncbi:MAG: acetylornithine deacetylase [Dongiaceae bacterium]
MSESLAILDRLIAFPTVSRDSNLALIGFARDRLAAAGAAVELVANAAGDKANLLAIIGPRDKPGIILSGHSDVVPVEGQAWSSDPFRLTERDGRLHGRGTADMKGFLAAALAAVERARGRTFRHPLILSFSHDEEIGCIGVRSLLEVLPDRIAPPLCCVVGEPTGFAVMLGHKGKLSGTIACRGRAGHSSLAPHRLNAIHLACDMVGEIRRLQDEIAATGRRDPDYDVPYTTLHVGRIAGGTALNIVPDACSLEFEIRHLAADDPEALLERLRAHGRALAGHHHAGFPEAAVEVAARSSYPGLDTPSDAAVVDLVAGLVGERRLGKIDFGTEGGLFHRRLAVPTVICGPGSIGVAHQPDEHLAPADLARCDAMLDRLIDRIAA